MEKLRHPQNKMFAPLSAQLQSPKNRPSLAPPPPSLAKQHVLDHQKHHQQRRQRNQKCRKKLNHKRKKQFKSSNPATRNETKRLLNNDQGVESAAQLAHRRSRMLQEESHLDDAIHERMLVLSKVLPAELLQGSALAQSFLQSNGINVLNKIADRLLNALKRDAWNIWLASTVEQREKELAARLAMFSQQGGMRKLKRLFGSAMQERTIRMWNIWRKSTVVLRHIEQLPNAIRIQSCMRMFLVRNWLSKATRSCLMFQQLWRTHASRQIIRAMMEHRLRENTVLKIQRRWRERCAWREVQQMRMNALKKQMNSMAGGRNSAELNNANRKNRKTVALLGGEAEDVYDKEQQLASFSNSITDALEKEAEELMALAMTGHISMEEVKRRLQDIDNRMNAYKNKSYTSAIAIQNIYRRYISKCHFLIRMRNIKCATSIQAGYRGYCGRRYASATLSIHLALIEATRHSASFAITSTWRTYRVRKMQKEALLTLVNIIQETQRNVACIKIQDAFREQQLNQLLINMELEMTNAFEYAAVVIQKTIRGHQHYNYCKYYKICDTSVRVIQRMFYCYRAKGLGKKIVWAGDLLTRWSRSRLYHMKLNTLRRRVLHRWARRRHLILRRIMSSWPGWASVGARRDRVIKHGQAVRHYKLHIKSKIILHLQTFVALQHQLKLLYAKAYKWWKKSLLAKAFRTYKANVLEILNHKRLLLHAIGWWNKRSMVKGFMQFKLYYEWRLFRKNQYKEAFERYNALLKKRVVLQLVESVKEKKRQIMKAAQWFFATQQRQSWIQWKKYLAHRVAHHEQMKKGIDHANDARQWYREMKGLKRWMRWLKDRQFRKQQIENAVRLWSNQKISKVYRTWLLFVKLEKGKRLAIEYYNEKHRTLCVQHWHDWSVHKKIWRKKMVVLNKKAMKYWKSRKAAPPFLKWKALWSQANKDRLEREENARIVLQRVGRGLLGRKKAKIKR